MSIESTANHNTSAIPWWVRLIVILGAIVTTTGAFIALFHPAMLVSPHDEINDAVRIYAGQLAARNLAIALILGGLLLIGAKRAFSHLMILVVLIQMLDVCMGAAEGRWMIVPGVLLIGVLFLIAAARLCEGTRLWKIEAWMR